MIDRSPSISLRVTSCTQLLYDFVAQAVWVPKVGISASRAQCRIWEGGNLGSDLSTWHYSPFSHQTEIWVVVLDKQFNLLVTEELSPVQIVLPFSQSDFPFARILIWYSHCGCSRIERIDFSWQGGQVVRRNFNNHVVKSTRKSLETSDLGRRAAKRKAKRRKYFVFIWGSNMLLWNVY